MIVIDTSALVAIFRKEPDATRFEETMLNAERCLFSTVNHLEASLVMIGRGPPLLGEHLDAFILRAGIDVVPFDREQLAEARTAFVRFGKGRHPAGLSIADCAAYALARRRGLPLLFKGSDFSKTDVVPAV